jgi:hypothetical protein
MFHSPSLIDVRDAVFSQDRSRLSRIDVFLAKTVADPAIHHPEIAHGLIQGIVEAFEKGPLAYAGSWLCGDKAEEGPGCDEKAD